MMHFASVVIALLASAIVAAQMQSKGSKMQVRFRVHSVPSATIGSRLFNFSSPEVKHHQSWTLIDASVQSWFVLHAKNVSVEDVQVYVDDKMVEIDLIEKQCDTGREEGQLVFGERDCVSETVVHLHLPFGPNARLLLGSKPVQECPDPFVAKLNPQLFYLFCTAGNVVKFYISSTLNFVPARSATVVFSQAVVDNISITFRSIWAPEMHMVGGSFKIYFSAETVTNPGQHRLYVARHTGGNMEQASNWKVSRLQFSDGRWMTSYAIDPTVFSYQGVKYILFSSFFPTLPPNPPNCCGAPDDKTFSGPQCRNANGQQCFDDPNFKPQNIAIGQLENDGLRVRGLPKIIAKPDDGKQRYWNEWNRVNEGPAVVFRGQTPVIIYSAGYFALDNYNLKQLDYTPVNTASGVLGPENWTKRFANRLALGTSVTNQVYGPGHCAFVNDENGNPLVVYHGRRQSVNVPGGDRNRYVRAQSFSWSADGMININGGVPLPAAFS